MGEVAILGGYREIDEVRDSESVMENRKREHLLFQMCWFKLYIHYIEYKAVFHCV